MTLEISIPAKRLELEELNPLGELRRADALLQFGNRANL
jgi:hypothetical protein